MFKGALVIADLQLYPVGLSSPNQQNTILIANVKY